ncbi:unnamed protein product [Effrenium voratum]|uniref:PROP1-like PPR domain-containing protein n=1 Tax=Effrenium voratum TaxID=2562239 RepID=A0AA36ICN7_9DINO|nr:unnamed protein product [Effrenium voratum]
MLSVLSRAPRALLRACAPTAKFLALSGRLGARHSSWELKPEREERRRSKNRSFEASEDTKQSCAEMQRLQREGRLREALDIYPTIQEPNPLVHTMALTICQKANWLEEAKEIWEKFPVEERDVIPYCIMINILGYSRRLREAEELYEEMESRNVELDLPAYTSIMNAYGQSGNIDKAKDLFQRVPKQAFEEAELRDKERCFLTLMTGHAKLGEYAGAREVFVDMLAKDVRPNRKHFNALISACARDALAETAQGVFDLMPQYGECPTLADWTALLACYRNDLAATRKVFEDMQAAGCQPDALAYCKLLEAHVLAEDGAGARALAEDLAANLPEKGTHPVLQRLVQRAERLP